MIRKVTMAAFALAALGLAPGCENQRRSAQHEVVQEKKELSQAQQEAPQQAQEKSAQAQQKAQEESTQARQEAQEESAQAQQQAQEKIASEQQDVNEAQAKEQQERQEEQQKLTQAQKDQQEADRLEQQQQATGGSGAAAGGAAAAAQTATGSVSKASANELTLKPQAGGEPLKLSVDQNTRVMRDGQAISPDAIQEGDEVRASYQQQGGQNVATEVTVEKAGTGGSGAWDDAKKQGSEAWEGTKQGAEKLENDVTQ